MKSILSLPPVLQAVWTAVYASVIASPHNTSAKRSDAEEQAWEAVRRANGGEMPSDDAESGWLPGESLGRWRTRRSVAPLPDTDAFRLAILKEAIEQPCPVTGEPFFMVLKHPDLGWVPTYGGPRDSWTAPETDGEDEEAGRAPMLYRYHYDHDEGAWGEYEAMGMRAVVATRPLEEPTDEEMAEALAPIVAAHDRKSWKRADDPTRNVWIRQAKGCLRGDHDYASAFVEAAIVAKASWKAARAWGRK